MSIPPPIDDILEILVSLFDPNLSGTTLLVTCVLIPPLGRCSLSAVKAGCGGVQDPSSVDVQIKT